MSKVIGIGWAKTGTTTLGTCFRILGFDHQSQDLDLAKDLRSGDLSRILAVASAKHSFEDWPWVLVYRELDEAFPGSRFVLTKRRTDRWLRSYRNMLAQEGKPSRELTEIRRILYGLPFPDVSDSQLIERYDRHNAEVEHYFRGRSQDLLIVDWEQAGGWKELCEFLGKNIPREPFPHANKGRYANRSITARLLQTVKRYSS